jgi:hypothetical protein
LTFLRTESEETQSAKEEKSRNQECGNEQIRIIEIRGDSGNKAPFLDVLTRRYSAAFQRYLRPRLRMD